VGASLFMPRLSKPRPFLLSQPAGSQLNPVLNKTPASRYPREPLKAAYPRTDRQGRFATPAPRPRPGHAIFNDRLKAELKRAALQDPLATG